ncbi:MAG: transaldolase, partial [Elusimicrobiota bacterium]
MSNNLKRLAEFGQSPWIDMISRTMIDSGELQRLRDEDGLKGLTSNPSIFEAAIARSSDYDEAIARALRRGIEEPKALFEELAVRDIRDAADLLLPIYEESGGADGFVSLEVSPELAYDTERTIAEGERLFKQVGRKNLMIKVPATSEGLPAAAQLIGRGINVNVTLIFSIQRYREVMESYLEGLEALAKSGKPLAAVASVASFFISRLDTAIDEKLPAGSPLRGKAAVANAKIAYQTFQEIFSAPRFAALRGKGALVQRPLWASTGTKNADYNDVLYVDGLIGRDTVNTIPPKTWAAFRDHGSPTASLTAEVEAAETTIKELAAAGIDLDAVTSKLEKDGVDAFMRSFQTLLDSIRDKASHLHNDPDPAEIVQRLWDKDASLWKDEAAHKAIIANSLGWLRMPQTMPDRIEGIETFVREVLDEGFQHVVVLGMGGSSLAPEVFRRTLPTASGYPTLHVLDSTDPETVSSVEQAAPPAKTLYIVASKSGTTVEPMRFFDYFYGVLKKAKGGEAGKHFVAITDPGRALMAQAQELGFRKIFLNFEDIGGRFSALSYFGLVPAALAGADIGELLERAHKMADA